METRRSFRTTPLRVVVAVICLLVLHGFALRLLPGWALKPLFGWNWLAWGHLLPSRASREMLTGALCVTGYVRDAISRADEEHAHVEAERDAFSEFASAVRGIEASPQQSLDTPTATLVSQSPDQKPVETVRNRYRETVMDVPDYEREYGESLPENMRAELGEEVTAAVLDGGRFTPHLKGALLARTEAAATQRRTLLNALDAERESLSEARSRLEATEMRLETCSELELSERSFEELLEYDHRSRRNEKRCRELLSERQRDIHRRNRRFSDASETSLQQYLYGGLDFRFPALRAGVERIRQLRDRRRLVTRTIGRLD